MVVVVLLHHVFTAIYYVLPEATADWQTLLIPVAGSEITLPIYFVLSGFVMFLPVVMREGRIGSLPWYAVRRVARIVPAYYATLVFLVIAWPYLFPDQISPMASRFGIQSLISHLTFTQKIFLAEEEIGFGMNGSVWTLTLEELFYVTVPMTALAVYRWPFRMLGASLFITLAWRLACLFLPTLADAFGLKEPAAHVPGHLFHQFPGYVFQFACGAATAWLYVKLWGRYDTARHRPLLRGLHVSCIVLLVVEILLAGVFREKYNGIVIDLQRDMTPAIVVGALILVTSLGPGTTPRLYEGRFVRFLGDTSYGIYLWHMILIQLVVRWLDVAKMPPAQASAVLVALVVPGSLLCGWLSLTLVERPANRYIRSVWRDSRRLRERAAVSQRNPVAP